MPFKVVSPPNTESALAEEGKKILQALDKKGKKLNVEGFLQAWVTGIRVVVELDNNMNYTGVAFLVVGDRWLHQDRAVTVLYSNVEDKEGLLSFARSIAIAFGATQFIYELGDVRTTPNSTVSEVVAETL